MASRPTGEDIRLSRIARLPKLGGCANWLILGVGRLEAARRGFDGRQVKVARMSLYSFDGFRPAPADTEERGRLDRRHVEALSNRWACVFAVGAGCKTLCRPLPTEIAFLAVRRSNGAVAIRRQAGATPGRFRGRRVAGRRLGGRRGVLSRAGRPFRVDFSPAFEIEPPADAMLALARGYQRLPPTPTPCLAIRAAGGVIAGLMAPRGEQWPPFIRHHDAEPLPRRGPLGSAAIGRGRRAVLRRARRSALCARRALEGRALAIAIAGNAGLLVALFAPFPCSCSPRGCRCDGVSVRGFPALFACAQSFEPQAQAAPLATRDCRSIR